MRRETRRKAEAVLPASDRGKLRSSGGHCSVTRLPAAAVRLERIAFGDAGSKATHRRHETACFELAVWPRGSLLVRIAVAGSGSRHTRSRLVPRSK